MPIYLDMLTDEVAQVHRSPGFITSNLIGKKDDGTMIKGEYAFVRLYAITFVHIFSHLY